MSRSLQSSIEYFGGSKRWSRNDSDMVPWKSSIGLISSKISSRPDLPGTSSRPLARAASTRDVHFSLPSRVSKLSVCSARRFGTSRGSRIFAKEMRRGAVLFLAVLAGSCRWCWRACWRCARRPRGVLPRAAGLCCVSACRTTQGKMPRVESDGSAKRQHTRWAGRPQVGPCRRSGRVPVPLCCHGASRMDPPGPGVKALGVHRASQARPEPVAPGPEAVRARLRR